MISVVEPKPTATGSQPGPPTPITKAHAAHVHMFKAHARTVWSRRDTIRVAWSPDSVLSHQLPSCFLHLLMHLLPNLSAPQGSRAIQGRTPTVHPKGGCLDETKRVEIPPWGNRSMKAKMGRLWVIIQKRTLVRVSAASGITTLVEARLRCDLQYHRQAILRLLHN